MWKSGSTQSVRSPPSVIAGGSVRVAVSMYCAQAAARLAWVSIAPFGRPVVPPVYWMTASVSVGSLIGWAS